MAEEDEAATEVDHAREVIEGMFVTGNQSPEVLKPGEEALDMSLLSWEAWQKNDLRRYIDW